MIGQEKKKRRIQIRPKKNKSCTVFLIDSQALKIYPVLQINVLYCSMKLKVHNMTFYNNATADYQNYWWHEDKGELDASVFVSIVQETGILCICMFILSVCTNTRV
jgi:hypothetical protein